MTVGGSVRLVKVVESGELEENGGVYHVVGREAVRVTAVTSTTRAIGGMVIPVYVVSDAELEENGGVYNVFSPVGGVMLVGNVSVLGGSERTVNGRGAVPVYVVDGSL